MKRTCLDCGTPTTGSRCPTHQAERDARWQGDWPAQSKAAIQNYRTIHGDICPGWGVSPHPIAPSDWVTDHDEGPLCRACNGRKAGGHDKGYPVRGAAAAT